MPVEPHILIKHRQLCRKDVQPKVSFACAIYHTSKHFCTCVDACAACNCTPLLKRPANISDHTHPNIFLSTLKPRFSKFTFKKSWTESYRVKDRLKSLNTTKQDYIDFSIFSLYFIFMICKNHKHYYKLQTSLMINFN